MYDGSSIILNLIFLFVFCICRLVIADKFNDIAKMKGYDGGYFGYCFFFGIFGALMVVALPDRSNQAEDKSTKETDTTRKPTISQNTAPVKPVQVKEKESIQPSGPISMYIDSSICVGCGSCKKICPNHAIDGELKQPHKINEYCLECGLCMDVCKLGAIKQ